MHALSGGAAKPRIDQRPPSRAGLCVLATGVTEEQATYAVRDLAADRVCDMLVPRCHRRVRPAHRHHRALGHPQDEQHGRCDVAGVVETRVANPGGRPRKGPGESAVRSSVSPSGICW